MTIRAIQINPDASWMQRLVRFGFELTTSDDQRLIYCRRAGDSWSGGWYAPSDFPGVAPGTAWDSLPEPEDGQLAPVIVELPRDVAAALADAILTEAHGTPAGDVRALRRDLEHEQTRRDLLEDHLVGTLRQFLPRP
jgi:hypothetical protein